MTINFIADISTYDCCLPDTDYRVWNQQNNGNSMRKLFMELDEFPTPYFMVVGYIDLEAENYMLTHPKANHMCNKHLGFVPANGDEEDHRGERSYSIDNFKGVVYGIIGTMNPTDDQLSNCRFTVKYNGQMIIKYKGE
jgi:hypothetical protein